MHSYLAQIVQNSFLIFKVMTKQKLNYSEAIDELEIILSELEKNTDVNMEVITQKVKRAAELMEFCKKQLHVLNTELEKMLDDLAD